MPASFNEFRYIPGMQFQVTIRYGGARQPDRTLVFVPADAQPALRAAADAIPAEIAPHVDLVELREAVDPDRRDYLGDDAPHEESGPPGRTSGDS